jgi:shikimate dehydrogenase
MTDRYAVIGNPVAHSKSPLIHAAFAQATAQDLSYERLLAPLDGFIATVDTFRAQGGRGCNVTVPFKEAAFAYATQLTEAAREAGAVNTLKFDGATVLGDNTDGAGLVADIAYLGASSAVSITGVRVLIAGAGGATMGVIGPLLRAGAAHITIANRTVEKAQRVAARFAAQPVHACGYADLANLRDDASTAFTIVINATSASLGGEAPPLPPSVFTRAALAYDMMYGKGDTPFMLAARSHGAAQVADGLGMLAEQAAQAFYVWRGDKIAQRPHTDAVRQLLRTA